MNVDEAFTLIMIEFEKLHARLDKLDNPVNNVTINPVDIQVDPCYWQNLASELRNAGLNLPNADFKEWNRITSGVAPGVDKLN